jgi:hypothetical protein
VAADLKLPVAPSMLMGHDRKKKFQIGTPVTFTAAEQAIHDRVFAQSKADGLSNFEAKRAALRAVSEHRHGDR